MLAEHGVRPVHAVTLPDHAPREHLQIPPSGRAPIDLWLATPKCRIGRPLRARDGVALATLEYELTLSPRLQTPLDAIAHSVTQPAAIP